MDTNAEIPMRFTRQIFMFFLAGLVAGHGTAITRPLIPAPGLVSLNLVVNSTADAVDVNAGDGVCATATVGQCTLRAAIIETNSHAGPDTITFGINGTFLLSLMGASEEFAMNGDLDILEDLTITGNGMQNTVIDGGGPAVHDRVFHVDPAGAGMAVSIVRLTIRNGDVSGNGGGLLNDGKARLTMNNVTVSANSADSVAGVYNLSNFATLTLTKVIISGNRATNNTGGLGNHGVVTLTDVTVDSNTAGGTGGLSLGGVATLTNVTVSRNTSKLTTTGAGGLELGGKVTLINTTISGNHGDPGAIWNGGRSTLTNVTISDNTGGIQNCDNCPGSQIVLKNTIIANSAFIFNLNCQGTITSGGHNLDSGNGCGFNGPGDKVNIDPALGSLAASVGRTQTHPLLSTSPALDAGDNALCPSTDQRGVARPQGPACDIGAYEHQMAAFVVNTRKDGPDATPGDGMCQTSSGGLCSLRAAVMESNIHPGPDLITFGVNGIFPLLIAGANEDAAATGDLDITDDLTIRGNGRTRTAIVGGSQAGQKDRLLHVDPARAGIAVTISGVTIRKGNGLGFGGGILNESTGTLTLTDAAVRSNSVGGTVANGGGGIWNGGQLVLTNVTISSNAAKGNIAQQVIYGGGIVNAGSLTLSHSTVTANTSDENGGGIWNGTDARLTVLDSTINGNTAAARGGAVWNHGDLSLINVTVNANVTGNTTSGAIHNTLGRATLLNVTLSDNNGGGISSGGVNAIATLKNTIIANSTFGSNCSGTITSSGHNLDSGSTCGFSGPGDITIVNPRLGPLMNNGGLTYTRALLPGSPAIDAGDNLDCPLADQRDVSRPQRAACDMGAFEVE